MNIRLCLSISVLLLAAPVLRAQLPANWPADYPAWWYHPADPASGVIDATAPTFNQDNAALLNQGQLWNLAEHGIAELDRSLAPLGGAGFTLEDFREAGKSPDYYAPANLGQLKAVSSKFYDRFAAIGFAPGALGWPTGMTLDAGTGYPWSLNVTPSNAAPANLGQAKHLFSWDLSSFTNQDPNADSDGDGLTNAEEAAFGSNPDLIHSDSDTLTDYQEYHAGTDPNVANTLSTDTAGTTALIVWRQFR